MNDPTRFKTILAVDDTPENLRVVSAVLKDEFKVRVATRGEHALKLLADDARSADLILLDINMPGMDGYDVCKRLKQDPMTAAIPVIFLTARAEVDNEARGFELGAVDYITKPISPPHTAGAGAHPDCHERMARIFGRQERVLGGRSGTAHSTSSTHSGCDHSGHGIPC